MEMAHSAVGRHLRSRLQAMLAAEISFHPAIAMVARRVPLLVVVAAASLGRTAAEPVARPAGAHHEVRRIWEALPRLVVEVLAAGWLQGHQARVQMSLTVQTEAMQRALARLDTPHHSSSSAAYRRMA